jgi:PAS domain S-box-containing protein
MESDWKWEKLDPLERQIAELLVEGKSNAAICREVYLSRARVQNCIKRIQIKTGTDGTRAAIATLVEERESQTLLWALEQARTGIGILQDRLLKFANRALGDILGYDREEIEGRPLEELLGPRRRDAIVKRYDMTMRGEPYIGTHVITAMCKDGQEKEVIVDSGGLVQYRGRPAVLAMARSLDTEEEETRALISVLEQATQGVAILQDGVFKFVNKALAEIHGYDDPAEMTGKPFVELLAPRARAIVAKRYELRMRDSAVPRSYVTRILCKDGQEKTVTVASAGLIRYKGRPAILASAVPHIREKMDG